jgi:hypothetical protein
MAVRRIGTGAKMNPEFLQFCGQVTVRSLAILSTLIIARLAPTSVLGDFLQLQITSLVALTLMFWRYERAIIDEPSLRGAIRATRLCLVIGAAAIVPLALASAFMVAPVRPTVHPYVFLILCAGMAMKGMQLICYHWAQRLRLLGLVGWFLLTQIIVQGVLQVSLLQTAMRPLTALLLGEFIALAVFVMLVMRCSGSLVTLNLRSLRTRALHRFAIHRQDLPTHNLPGALLSQSLLALPLLFFAMKAHPDVTGHFALALRLSDALFLVLAAATTALWIGHRIWTMEDRKMGVWFLSYVALLTSAALAFLALGWAADHWASVPNWVGAAQWVVPAMLWSAAIGLSGPVVDIVGYQQGDRPALLTHWFVLIIGFLAAFLVKDAVLFLWAMVTIAWLRAAIFIGLFLRLRRSPRASLAQVS